ncbi:MAG: C4-type zinc ribbon domain-containing protein [Candidatus Dadabacteria bacterium]|nr:C4-type zinc ribbon domain-containing protein [Candidatus Dadabacteria bacterium]
MQQHIESLQKLQTVDLRIRELTEGLERYPNEIDDLKKDLLEKEESINFKETSLSELKAQRDGFESSLRSNQESIKKSEERLFAIKTHKEYEALQKEITDTRKENLEIEDRTISVMAEIEETEATLAEEKENYVTLKEQYAGQIAEKEKKIEELEISRKPAEKEKSEILSTIDPKILPLYERIFKRNGRALALAENEQCTSCNINIPPQLYNEILKQTKLVQCPNCKKILYTNP